MKGIEVKKIRTLTGHTDCLYTLEKLDENRFFSAGGDGMVVMWDLRELDAGKMVVKVPSSIYALSYNSKRDLLVVGQNFSGIHLIDIEGKKEVGSVAITKEAIFDITTSDEFIYVVTGSGGLIQLNWELEVVHQREDSNQSARSISLSPNGDKLAVGYSDQMVRIFKTSGMELFKSFEAHQLSIFTVKYHPVLPVLLSGSRDARFKVWDMDNDYQLVTEVVGHLFAINNLVFSPEENYFATCSMDKSIKVWDAQTFKLLKVIDKARHAGHGTSVNKLLWMDYENWLVSCSDDRTISIWDLSTPH